MNSSARKLADRYLLDFDADWVRWFDSEWATVRPAGAMCQALSAEVLSVDAPSQIWPGFMLPDTLPVVGNEYGDWICARIGAEGRIDELIYWYHGGGDWIPVGCTLAEAFLHDAIDGFRAARKQMLRGATESKGQAIDNTTEERVFQQLEKSPFRDWLLGRLPAHAFSEPSDRCVSQVAHCLRQDDYRGAIGELYRAGWAKDAAACDLIEYSLQTVLRSVATPAVAESIGVAWYPDFVGLLFDTEQWPRELQARVERVVQATELDGSTAARHSGWPVQDWNFACQLADEVLDRRSDVGWAFSIAGWARRRVGDVAGAAEIYWRGRHASSFADQSVRLNCHGIADEVGKFAIQQFRELYAQRGGFPAEVQRSMPAIDPYTALFVAADDGGEQPGKSRLAVVHDYWWANAKTSLQSGDYASAYHAFYAAGWDMGVSRLSDYLPILEGLVESARGAGWHARAAIAATHLQRLKSR